MNLFLFDANFIQVSKRLVFIDQSENSKYFNNVKLSVKRNSLKFRGKHNSLFK